MYGDGDLNWAPEDTIRDLFEPAIAEQVLSRRKDAPFDSVWELLAMDGVTEADVRDVASAGLHTGPVVALNMPLEFRTIETAAVAAPSSLNATTEIISGVAQMLNAVELLAQRDMLLTQVDDDEVDGVTIPDTQVDGFERFRTHHGPPHEFSQRRVTFPAYCAVAWILTNGANGAVGNGGSALGAGSKLGGAAGIRRPTQAAVNTIAADVRTANAQIFAKCKFVFKLCRVHVLDTAVAKTANQQQALADVLFQPGGVMYTTGNPLRQLYEALSTNYNQLFDTKCLNVFYVGDIQTSAKKPDNLGPNGRKLVGLGSDMTDGARLRGPQQHTPMALSEGGWNTFAHEAIHGMGIGPHAAQSNDKAVRNDPANIMKANNGGASIQPSQIQQIQKFAAQYLKLGC